MKFTEIQRKLHQLLNEYEAAVIAKNRGRNRSCYNEIELVANYIKGKNKSNIRAYARDFSKVHQTVDLYELVTGNKLGH